jgi:hypothetical protein
MTIRIRFDLSPNKKRYYITETIDYEDLMIYKISELRTLIEKYKRDIKCGRFKI